MWCLPLLLLLVPCLASAGGPRSILLPHGSCSNIYFELMLPSLSSKEEFQDRLFIPTEIRLKIYDKHKVKRSEIREAFKNRTERIVPEPRLDHQKDEPRFWFITKTDAGRELKIILRLGVHGRLTLVSAYEADAAAKEVYAKILDAYYP